MGLLWSYMKTLHKKSIFVQYKRVHAKFSGNMYLQERNSNHKSLMVSQLAESNFAIHFLSNEVMNNQF